MTFSLVFVLLLSLSSHAVHTVHRRGPLRAQQCNGIDGVVDDLVIGGGPAGVHYTFRRTSLSEPASLLLVEMEQRVGGALKGVPLRHPVTGEPTGQRMALGALRTGTQLSFHQARCLADELGMIVQVRMSFILILALFEFFIFFQKKYSPFWGMYLNRGVRQRCAEPIWNGPDVPEVPYDADPFQWGGNCGEDDVWHGNATCPGRYLNVRNDLEGAFYNWLTVQYLCFFLRSCLLCSSP